MVPQTTKFSYVYDELKQRITDGQILPGNRLPSSRQLCDEFQVSLYTINNVLEALKEEGLIENQPRLAPQVVLRKNMPHPENIVLSILKVSAKYSYGFPNPQDSSIIVAVRYLDYFTTMMEDRLWQVIAKPVFLWQNRSGLLMNAARAA